MRLRDGNDACGGPPAAALPLRGRLSLSITPLIDPSGQPVGRATLPALPAQLPPAADADVTVRIGGGLAPGWYVATPTQRTRAGAAAVVTPTAWYPAMDSFLVTGAGRPAGTVARTTGPAPAVGGLVMPLIRVSWSPDDLADFEVHAPVVCGPGTTRAMYLVGAPGAVYATASGPGFATALPEVGGGLNPGKAENSFEFGPFPGEATVLTLRLRVLVNSCHGTVQGPETGSGTAVWRVDLP